MEVDERPPFFALQQESIVVVILPLYAHKYLALADARCADGNLLRMGFTHCHEVHNFANGPVDEPALHKVLHSMSIQEVHGEETVLP